MTNNPNEFKPMSVIGLMSGTSMDGIDVALITSDGSGEIEAGPHMTVPYSRGFRDRLGRFIEQAPEKQTGTALEQELTDVHADAVRMFAAQSKINLSSVDLIGFHGQTVWHRPQKKQTWQMGDGERLANTLGIPVIFDFRSADVEAGGQGAPLAPVFHRAMARDAAEPVAVLNIGGVANVTWIAPDGDLIAFDTGPGGGLLDDWMRQKCGKPMDENGELAAQGEVRADLVAEITSHPYLAAPPPKSLDRFDFKIGPIAHLNEADGAATLTALTAECIRLGLAQCPNVPKTIYVTGGGRHNATLMTALSKRTGAEVHAVEHLGWNGDAIEAQAFAYMAVRHLRGMPITFPGTTGVAEDLTGGRLVKPSKY